MKTCLLVCGTLRRSYVLPAFIAMILSLPLAITGATIAQEAYIKASYPQPHKNFGYSVAASSDTMVIGAPCEASDATGVNGDQTNSRAFCTGAAYVFVREGITWRQQAYLKASNTWPGGEGCSEIFGRNCDGHYYGDQLGYSVAVSGDTIVVGAPGERSNATGVNGDQNDRSATNSGAAYVFVREGTNWSQQAYLKASNTEEQDTFGVRVAISGDTVIIASRDASAATGVNGDQSDNSAPLSGAAYVFVRSGTNWSQQAYLKASNTDPGDQFGVSIAISGDTLVVGANAESSAASGVNGDQNDNSLSPGAGAAYVFVRTGTNWSQQAYLKSSNPAAYEDFGWSVDVSGDTVVVGALGESDDSPVRLPGGAYVFVRTGTNWTPEASLIGSNIEIGDFFGFSVAVAGDTILVGAPAEDSSAHGVNGDQGNNSAPFAGAAYVFRRGGTNWSQQAYLKGSNTRSDHYFGFSSAMSGETVVVGAYAEYGRAAGVNGNQCNNGFFYSGAAYVFDLDSAIVTFPEISVEQPAGNDLTDGSASVDFGHGLVGGNFQRTFTIKNTGTADLVGLGTTMTGPQASDFTVTASPGALVPSPCGSNTFTVTFTPATTGPRTATLHIHSNDSDESPFDIALTGTGITASEQAYLKASNAASDDRFGYSVAVSGPIAVVGAPSEDYSGAAYVFVRIGTTWIQQAYLIPSNREENDYFGWSVAVSGDTIVVGAYGESSNATGVNGDPSDNSAPQSGAAYIFVRSGTHWRQQAYLKASNSEPGDQFGYSVAISGDTVLIGALLEDSNARNVNGVQTDNSAGNSGAAYVFVRNGTNWTQQAYLKASNSGTDDYFGVSAAIAGDTAVVGAHYEDSIPNNVRDSGAAYVFARSGTNWSSQAYLKASNAASNDFFGISVAVSGNTVVVGAHGEDSNATGVNGNQGNNSATDSGAAYVFLRNGPSWSQQAYLKPSNTGTGDNFGYAVAVSDDIVIAGAHLEDSNATQVDGDGSDNSAMDSGAAYAFVRSGTNWSQQAYLKASNTGGADYFGRSVAVSGDTALVGAYGEAGSANNYPLSGAAYVFTGLGFPVTPFYLTGPTVLGNGAFQMVFTNTPGATFTLLTSTNVSLARSNWIAIGVATETSPGYYEFTDPQPAQNMQRFYRAYATVTNSSFQPPDCLQGQRFDTNAMLALPDFVATTSYLTVSGLTGHLATVTVLFHITHEFDRDLRIDLIGPDATTVSLVNRRGAGRNFGANCTDMATVLCDEATIPISGGTPPFVGVFLPEQPLSAFSGKETSLMNGQWGLRIFDAALGDTGQLRCWSLIFTMEQ